jgi:quercetin dioxygenase-like cupin family protein
MYTDISGTKRLRPVLMVLAALVYMLPVHSHELGSNKMPLSFGNDQTTIDLSKIVWEPLNVEGLDPGAEIAVLRGDLGVGVSESLLKLPPNYVVPNHNHSSDELYVWLSGAFTLTSSDGVETNFSGPAYLSFPGNNPPHALKCGEKESCILFLRYERPFDINYFPDP